MFVQLHVAAYFNVAGIQLLMLAMVRTASNQATRSMSAWQQGPRSPSPLSSLVSPAVATSTIPSMVAAINFVFTVH